MDFYGIYNGILRFIMGFYDDFMGFDDDELDFF